MAPPWLFGIITKDQAATMLMVDGAYPTGRFLVRRRPGSEEDHVLSLNYKNRPTHHLIQTRADGVLTVNKQDFGGLTTLEQIIEKLSSDSLPPKWPVRLTDGVQNKANAEQPPPDEAAAPPAQLDAPPATTEGQQQSTSSPAAAAANQDVPDSRQQQPWMHPPMTKAEADAKIKAHGAKEGTFLVRPRGASHPNEWVLSVVYKGKTTHHLLKQSDASSAITVNGNAMADCTRVNDVVAGLRTTKKFWPVPLQDHVPAAQTTETPPTATATTGADADAARRAEEERRLKEQKEEEERRRKAREEEQRRMKEQQEEEARKRREEEERREREEVERKRRQEEEEEKERRQKEQEEEEARRKREEEERREREEKEAEEKRRQKIEEEERAQQQSAEHTRTRSQLKERAREQARVQSRSFRGEHPQESSIHPHADDDESEAPSHMEPERGRRWENGEQFDIHIRRANPGVPFGFGIATMWRIDGRVKVVSWVDPEGPAQGALEVEDVIIAMDGDDADDMTLDQLKDRIRCLGNDFRARIFRPHRKTADIKQNLQAKVSGKKSRKKKKKPKAKHGECCGAIWCHHMYNMQKYMKEDEETLNMVMKVNKRQTSAQDRLQVLLNPRVRPYEGHSAV